jgi:hypothetical protein
MGAGCFSGAPTKKELWPRPWARPKCLFAIDQKSESEDQPVKYAKCIRRTVLFRLPLVLAAKIIEFAVALRHRWSTNPVENPASAIAIEGRKVTCSDLSSWYKIVSTTSIVNGPRRWKILVEFQKDSVAYIHIGVTLSPPKNMNLERRDWYIGSADHVLACPVQNIIYSRGRSHIDLFERTDSRTSDYLRAETRKCIILVEVYSDNQLMRIDAEGNEGEPTRNLLLHLQLPGQAVRDVDFRPCVILTGLLSATVLP